MSCGASDSAVAHVSGSLQVQQPGFTSGHRGARPHREPQLGTGAVGETAVNWREFIVQWQRVIFIDAPGGRPWK